MIRRPVWCFLILLVISENHCSPTDRDLYAFSTILHAGRSNVDGKSLGNRVQDSESAETNSFRSEDVSGDDSEEDPPGPEDHVIPYSEHEDPEEVPTRPKYVAPGAWAKPDPEKNIPLDFVPTKSLAQVRGTHTVKVLPQSDAIATATSDEERENAPRLRKVVSNKKTNTVYTEEGYEDSAYDHAGHIRDADFHEGYARKLHDQRVSKAKSGAAKGRRKKSKKKPRRKDPERTQKEFDEFTDDYSDEHAHSEGLEADGSSQRNDVNKISKDMWKRPDVNPKFVTENEVEKLENDLKREAEEAENGSEIHAEPDLHRDNDHEDTNERSTASEGESSRRIPSNSEYAPTTRGENFYTENYEATTTQFETQTPGDSQKYVTSTSSYENPTIIPYYQPEGSALQGNYETTTFTYGQLNNQQPVVNDAQTTVNYGDIFWKYFQSLPNEATSPRSYLQEQTTVQQPLLVGETTLGPYLEQNPVTLATINGHGPYLVLSETGEVTQNPNQFGFEGFSYYPPVQNGHQYRSPNAIPNDEHRLTNGQGRNSGNEQSFNGFTDSSGPATSAYPNLGLYNEEFVAQQNPGVPTQPSTPGVYDKFAFSRRPTRPNTKAQENLNHNIHNRGNYQDSLTNYPNLQVRNGEQSTSRIDLNRGPSPLWPKSQGKKEMGFFGYAPNLAYSKMLDYIRSQENHKYNGQKSESAKLDDFTIMKPPAFGESVFPDFMLNSYPNVADYSSETQESEAAQEANKNNLDSSTNGTKHNGLSQGDIDFKSPVFYGGSPPAAIDQEKSFPASRLLPPPLNSKNIYVDNNFPSRNIGHQKHPKDVSPQFGQNHGNGVQNFSPDPEQLARYLKERRKSSRYIRSADEAALSEVEIADALITQEINARFNSTSEIPRNLESKTKGDLTPRRFRRSHQGLLDASHKIAGDVVDGEIDSRFENKDHDAVEVDDDEDDEDDEARREELVEVDIPDLDYLDEIQDVNEITDIPTTTVASIDFHKYPFYKNSKVSNSPLKYIVNPEKVPKKTLGGMEFYDSRDRYIQCDELDPNLDEVLPEEEEPVPNRGPKQNLPRLRGLGDKLDCFKAKFFGENPFDNPIFFEKKITQPTPPSELDPIKFASRILELPKENMDYFVPALSRKPEPVAIKRADNNNVGTNSQELAENLQVNYSVDTRNKRRNNASHSKVRESSTEKPSRGTRNSRQRRPVGRLPTTTTELPEVTSVKPYQNEVYEDVMGTIKNLASLYEIYGAPITKAPNSGRILSAPSIRHVKTVNRVPSLNGKREMDYHSSGVTESPYHEEIEGLLPPPEMNKKPILSPYRTNKVSYNTRVRTESPLRNGDKKIVGYFRTVMVHKRSLDGYGGAPSDSKTDTTSSTTERPKRGRRRKTNLTTTTTTTVAPVTNDAADAETINQTPKPYYAIRSRSRNSKDANTTSRHGLFTTTERTSTTTDARRKEPRYTEIMRRRGQAARTTTTTPSSPQLSDGFALTTSTEANGSIDEHVTEPGEIYESEDSVSRKRKVNIKDIEPSASYVEPEHVEEDEENRENYEEEDEESSDEPVKKIRKYDVHEDVQEDTTPTAVGISSPTKPSEFVDLETYLLTDPPGYSAAFEDEARPKARNVNAETPEDEKESYEDEESKEEQVEEDEEAPQNDSYREEESSDEDAAESPKTSGNYKESSNDSADDSGEEKKSSETEDSDDMTFFRYESRPESPFESFEDDKYSELGPRINKPAFHHPTFKAPKRERNYFVDTKEDERDKADESFYKGKYVFPWAQDEEDEKLEAREGYVDEATGSYEYPWERRERLAKKRQRRREDRESMKELLGFSPFDDDDEDEDEKEASSSDKRGKQVYPWDRYDVPSKTYRKKFKKKDDFDNDETSSEHRPVTKFSSKYNSKKFRLPYLGGEPISTAQPKKIRESVTTYLREADEKSTEPTVAYETDILTTAPAPTEKIESTHEPTRSGPKSNKRISNSRIIPENITTAPRQRGRSKVTHVRDRTTLRPIVRTTTEAVKVEKEQIQSTPLSPSVTSTTEAVRVHEEQTTTAPITRRRRPSGTRGRLENSRAQPSYKAQESQVVSSTVLRTPVPTTTSTSTTEKPVESSTRGTVRFVVRRRGPKPKTVSSTPETELDVTERSTEATTTKSRRTRPTLATRLAITKRRPINDEIVKKPSRAGSKNEYRNPAKTSGNSGDRKIEDSTPTSRTVEHRSRVSKEEIITKTSFPKQDRNFKAYKDTVERVTPLRDNFDEVPFADPESKKAYSKTLDSGGRAVDERDSEDEYPDKNESVEKTSITTKETPEHIYEKKEVLDKDGHKGMFITIIPKNRTTGPSALEDELHLRKAKMEEFDNRKKPNYYNFDENETQNGESNGDVGSASSDDSLMNGHREVPPRSEESKESEEVSSEEYLSSEENSSEEHEDPYRDYKEGSNESAEDYKNEDESPVVSYVKDPSQRMYHYADLKK